MTLLSATLAIASIPLIAAAAGARNPRTDFGLAMDQAMDRMMAHMHVSATAEPDRDFVEMMVPHHQAAIDMAVAELCYGSNPRLKRIAQEIIVDQQQEIAAMRLAVGDPLPPSTAAPTHPACAIPNPE
jgi:uncharacterized protein (DUF305 family)